MILQSVTHCVNPNTSKFLVDIRRFRRKYSNLGSHEWNCTCTVSIDAFPVLGPSFDKLRVAEIRVYKPFVEWT